MTALTSVYLVHYHYSSSKTQLIPNKNRQQSRLVPIANKKLIINTIESRLRNELYGCTLDVIPKCVMISWIWYQFCEMCKTAEPELHVGSR